MGEVRQLGDSGSVSISPRRDDVDTVNVGAAAPPPTANVSISRYIVLEEVGRGGMGRVLRAYDPKLQREVALKEVRGDALDDEATKRLVAEARAMAKLAHPNVVAVFDVEELESGELVLVMEFVAGQTLRAFLRERERPWRDVVDAFCEAGRGLAAAHAAGLLHRDFKPANVLVSEPPSSRAKRAGGSMNCVKVTDFGLAKGVDSPPASSESTGEVASGSAESLTAAGTVMGTPRYMAPEQHRGAQLSSSADQYALCVALWEALHGQPPFRGPDLEQQKQRGPPSWRASDVPTRVEEAVRRGLSPVPSDRWPNMEALLEALVYDPATRRNRWLAGLAGFGAVAVAGLGIRSWSQARAQRCTGAAHQLTGVWDDARRSDVEAAIKGIGASYASGTYERAAALLDAYARDWIAMHTDACEGTTVRGEQSAAVMDVRMACLHRAKLDLSAAVDVLATADAEVVAKAHEVVAQLRPLQRCADVEALQADVEPPDPGEAEAVEVARTHAAQARAESGAGRYQAARKAVEAARAAIADVQYVPVLAEVGLLEGDVLEELGEFDAAQDALERALGWAAKSRRADLMAETATSLLFVLGTELGRGDEALSYVPLVRGLASDPDGRARLDNAIGAIRVQQGKYAEAEEMFRRALAGHETALEPGDPEPVEVLSNLSGALYKQGSFEEAETIVRQGLVSAEATLGPEHPDVAGLRSNLANILQQQGRYEEAEVEMRRALGLSEAALGAEHPTVAGAHTNLAIVLHRRGDREGAVKEFRRALALQEAARGPGHPAVAVARQNLATTLTSMGRFAEAEAELQQAISSAEATLGPEHPTVGNAYDKLGTIFDEQGKHPEAEAAFRRALALQEAALGAEHPATGGTRNNLGNAVRSQGRYEEAEAEHRRALEVLEAARGPEHAYLALVRSNLASDLIQQGRPEEAQVELRRALSIGEAAHGPDHPDIARTRSSLALLLLQGGRAQEALPFAEAAWTRRQADDIPPDDRAHTAFVLARVLWSAGTGKADRRRARSLAERALADYGDAVGLHNESIARVEMFLQRSPPRP